MASVDTTHRLIDKIARLGVTPDDSDDLRLKKSILSIAACFIGVLAVFWGGLYTWIGLHTSGAIPWGYAVISAISFFYFASTKNYLLFRQSQLLLILILPFLLQRSLGGFAGGSAVVIWGVVSPLAALYFSSIRSASLWLISYLLLIISSGAIDSSLIQPNPPMPENIKIVFFVLNTGFVGITIFYMLRYFSIDRENALTKMKELDQQKTLFFQNISHELRTPLTLIIKPLEQVFKQTGDSNIQTATRNAHRLLSLVNQLLDYQKLSQQKKVLHTQPVNIVRFVQTCVDHIKPICDVRGLSFDMAITGDEDGNPVYVTAEVDALEKILFNYLSNALKYTDSKLDLTVQCTTHSVTVSVADDGIGIAKQHQNKLFKLFSQVDGSTNRKYEGTGLGLALVKELADKMEAIVGIDSEERQGASFYVTLPRIEAPLLAPETNTPHQFQNWYLPNIYQDSIIESENQQAESLYSNYAKRERGQSLVLVVDDLSDMRQLISAILTDADFLVVTASNGEQALELAERTLPDIIVADWMMPVMNGIELTEVLRKHESLKFTPVILLTARSDNQSKTIATQCGADGFIGKPFEDLELVSTIKNLLHLKTVEKIERQRADAMQVAKEGAEQSNRQKSEYLANMSHELRTALNTIIGYDEILLEDIQDQVQIDDLNKIASSASHLLELVNGVLDLSKIEAGQVELYAIHFRVDEILCNVADMMRPMLSANNNVIIVNDHEDVLLFNDARKLRQVLLNLLSNANKFTQNGEIVISISDNSSDQVLAFSVKDSGIGMTPEQVDKVFIPYQQAEKTISEKYGGTGLGLSISQRLVQIMGGEIRAASKPGQGTRFDFTVARAVEVKLSKAS